MRKNPYAVALGKKRWAGKKKKEIKEHIEMMNKARAKVIHNEL